MRNTCFNLIFLGIVFSLFVFIKGNEQIKKELDSSQLPILTDANFTDFLKQNDFTLLFFHSPNCEPCLEILPEITKAHQYLQSLNPPRLIASIDIESELTSKIKGQYPMKLVPFFYLYSSKADKILPYSGLLTFRSVVTFVMKNTGKSVNNLSTLSHILSFIDDKITYMSVINFKEELANQFVEISKHYSYCLFANCFTDECRKYFQPKNDLIILKQFEEEPNKQRIDLKYTDSSKTINMINKNTLPLIGNMTDFATEIIFEYSLNTIGYIIANNNTDSQKEISEIKTNIDNENIPISHCFIFDITNNKRDISILRYLGFEVESFSVNKVFILSFEEEDNIKIYKKKKNQNIDTFIAKFTNGALTPQIKSEAKPTTHPKKNLKIIVGKTFDKEIQQNYHQDVILSFVTINCKECNLVQEIIFKLSTKFANVNSLLFGFTDPSSNDIPDIDVKDLLSNSKSLIRFYFKNKEKGYVDYKGQIKEDKIEEWILSLNPDYGESVTDL